MNCLQLDNLGFERDDVTIFQNVAANWQSGDIIQIAGHNGSGKTTLMRIIAGLLEPLEGRVTWNNVSTTDYDFKASLLYLGHAVGVKMTMTPLENLAWYFGLNGVKAENSSEQGDASQIISRERLSWALSQVGLSAYLDVPCYQLSAGQQRRVALARLYLSQAPLWILDEPFTAIDKAGVSALEQVIDQHASRGAIVMLTTHQAWHAEALKVLDLSEYSANRVI